MSQTYIPASGFAGKLRRLAARRLARTPLHVTLDRALVSFTFDDFPISAATAGAHSALRADRRGRRDEIARSRRCQAPKTTAAIPALPLRADRARRRRRPRALAAAPPATTRITPHPPVPRARALTSPVNLRFADFSRTTQ